MGLGSRGLGWLWHTVGLDPQFLTLLFCRFCCSFPPEKQGVMPGSCLPPPLLSWL